MDGVQMDGNSRGPGEGGGLGVAAGQADERGIGASDVPVVVVSLYGHGRRV